ncbi:MAG: iron-sulfur cluster repair di-iron protein [Chitinophagaceae bacterium]|jgi:regulator of cell morphogenesis and NO signaling|nr:iron-sulfur cluster repair di-iron protein [Chitinophagaceae bacterium]
MNLDKELKIAEVVSENIKAADIFKKHGIDFCCGGGISIAKACEKKNLNIDDIMSELKNLDNKILPSQNFNKWELDFLTDYIVNTHHAYVLEAIELLDAYSVKVAKVHGENHPPVLEIERLYNMVKMELLQHMQKEERILFPYIKQMVNSKNENCPLINSHFGTVQNPINMMQAEHENAGDVLKEIANLSMNYTPPEWACNTFKALYAKLDEFEQDLHLHVHLENNILFPKAIELEKSFQVLN